MSKKILIIEDNDLNMKLFSDILEYQGYKISKAFDGESGYEKIKQEKFDLIILDIQLPKMSGFDILKKLKDENKEYPEVIITSACAMDNDKLKAKELGIKTYITKPIDINNFILTVKNILN